MQFALDIALLAHRQATAGKQATIQLVHDHQCGGERNAGAPLPSRGHLSRQGQGRRRQRPDMVWPPGWRGEATTERSAAASACARWCCHSSPWRACGTCSRVVEGMRERRRVAAWRATGHLARVYKVQAVREDRVLLRSHSHGQRSHGAAVLLRTCGTGVPHMSRPAQRTTFFPCRALGSQPPGVSTG